MNSIVDYLAFSIAKRNKCIVKGEQVKFQGYEPIRRGGSNWVLNIDIPKTLKQNG